MAVCTPANLEFFIGIHGFRIFLQIVHHGMPHRVAERRLLPPEDLLRKQPVLRKRVSEQVFAHAVAVHLKARIDFHRAFRKRQIAKRYARFQ